MSRNLSRYQDYTYPEVRIVHQFLPESPLMLKYDDFRAYEKSGMSVQPGDVVRVPYGKGNPEALVLNVFHHRQFGGEIILKFRVCRRTKDGSWAKNWNYEFPGPIQRALWETYPETENCKRLKDA